MVNENYDEEGEGEGEGMAERGQGAQMEESVGVLEGECEGVKKGEGGGEGVREGEAGGEEGRGQKGGGEEEEDRLSDVNLATPLSEPAILEFFDHNMTTSSDSSGMQCIG